MRLALRYDTEPLLIVGGYGHVGSLVAGELARRGREVVVAGRDQARAEALGARLGCSGIRLDLTRPVEWDAALERAGSVLVCIDQADEAFVRRVLRRGLDFVDITASDGFFRRIESLESLAKQTGATALLSVGLAPGLTNLLVRYVVERLDAATRARIGIHLGLGDPHGRAAVAWMLHELSAMPFTPVLEPIRFAKAGPPVPAVRFDFADQHVVRRTLGLPDAVTLLSVESALWTRTLLRVRRLLRVPAIRRLLIRLLPRMRWGSETCAIAVEAIGTAGRERATIRAGFRGCGEARITAQVAVRAIELLPGVRRPGVHHIEQLFAWASFQEPLESAGPTTCWFSSEIGG